jgi:hypothetical protein
MVYTILLMSLVLGVHTITTNVTGPCGIYNFTNVTGSWGIQITTNAINTWGWGTHNYHQCPLLLGVYTIYTNTTTTPMRRPHNPPATGGAFGRKIPTHYFFTFSHHIMWKYINKKVASGHTQMLIISLVYSFPSR